MQTNDQQAHLENLRKQIHLSNCIDILMKQSLKLMDMVNTNQKEINDLKSEQDELKSSQQTVDELYTASEHMARNS